MTGVDREINEELELNCDYTQKAVALINDDSNEVGMVHIGVVHLFDLTGNDISSGESNIQDLQFLNKDKLITERGNLETWSQICLDNLDALLN
jgi:predicted NUDIX family phosphoesterase